MPDDLAPEVAAPAERAMKLALNSPRIMALAEAHHRAGLVAVITIRDAPAGQLAPVDADALEVRGVSPKDAERFLAQASETMKTYFAAPHDNDRMRMVFLHEEAVHYQVLRLAQHATS